MGNLGSSIQQRSASHIMHRFMMIMMMIFMRGGAAMEAGAKAFALFRPALHMINHPSFIHRKLLNNPLSMIVIQASMFAIQVKLKKWCCATPPSGVALLSHILTHLPLRFPCWRHQANKSATPELWFGFKLVISPKNLYHRLWIFVTSVLKFT